MKRVSQMTALAMALGLACASSWAAELAKPLTLDQLQQQNGKAIDTRPSAFYNGWPQTLNGPSGHEPAALNLSASWLDKMSTEQLWDTTMNPATRTLVKVSIKDAVEADKMFSILMGESPALRRRFIEENATLVKDLDV